MGEKRGNQKRKKEKRKCCNKSETREGKIKSMCDHSEENGIRWNKTAGKNK